MILSLEFSLALRFFRSKAKDRFISVITTFSVVGIMIGVATLIIVMSVMNGYERELIKRLSGFEGDIVLENYDEEDAQAIHMLLASNKDIASINEIVVGQGLIMNENGSSSGVMVHGMTEDSLKQKKIVSDNLVTGSLADFTERKVLLGMNLSQKLSSYIGGQLKVITPSGTRSMIGFMPKSKTFEVGGIFDTGMYEYNIGVVFINIEDAKLLYNLQAPNRLEINVLSGHGIEALTQELENALPPDSNALVTNKFNANNALKEALKVERAVMYMILTLTILVATFNIITSLIILVKDKRKNIAILKTFGASSNMICRVFIMTGSMIGLIGTLSGGVIGVCFVLNIERLKVFLERFTGVTIFDPVIYYLTNLPSDIDWISVITVLLTALSLSVLSTLYPSYRASRLMPAAILRND